MENDFLNILLITDNEDDYTTINKLLLEIEEQQFNLDWLVDNDLALTKIKHNYYHLCLYNLTQQPKLDFLSQFGKIENHIPLILLTEQKKPTLDLVALGLTGTNYLIKEQLSVPLLEHTIRYTFEYYRTLKKSQRQLSELAIIQSTAMVSASVTSENALIKEVATFIEEILEADNFDILIFDEEQNTSYTHPSYQKEQTVLSQVYVTKIKQGVIDAVIAKAKPLMVLNKVDLESYGVSNSSIASQLCVPIKIGKTVIGVINADSVKPNAFSKADKRLLVTVAEQLAVSIDKSRLVSTALDALIREQRLREIAHTIGGALDLPTILQNVVRLTSELTEAEAGALFLLSPDSQTITARYLYNLPEKFILQTRSSKQGIAWDIINTGKPLELDNYATHPQALFEWVAVGVQAFMGIPIVARGKCLGVLGLFTLTPNKKFTKRGLALAEAVGRQAGVAIQNAELYSESQHRADELAVALAKQEELDRLKNEFIQNVSHELRTPLAIVFGYVDLLHNGDLGELQPEQKEPIAIINSRVRVLNNLVDDLIAILKAQERNVNREPIDIIDLVKTVVHEFEVPSRNNNITLTVQIPDEMPIIWANIAQMRHVIDNLLTNALKFTDTGGQVIVRLLEEENNAILEVSDTGIGIPVEQYEQVFHRFYQIDGGTTRERGGTGLGLALVKEIVESYGGRVTVESVINEGSTFSVILPTDMP